MSEGMNKLGTKPCALLSRELDVDTRSRLAGICQQLALALKNDR